MIYICPGLVKKQPATKIISIHVQATTGKTLCSFKIKCKTGNKVIPRNSHLHINDMKKKIFFLSSHFCFIYKTHLMHWMNVILPLMQEIPLLLYFHDD